MVRIGTLIGRLAVSMLLAGCAAQVTPPSVPPTEKEFQVPAGLADEFEVRDASALGIAAAKPETSKVTPVAVVPPVKHGKGKKGKRKKGAKASEAAKLVPAAPFSIENRWTMAPFFRAGERIVFDITYFGATAGQLELSVLPEKLVAGRATYHFRAIATSTSIFSLFYRVNDVAESFMDTGGLFSHKFLIKLDESRQNRDVLELYDQNKRKAYYWSKLETPTKGVQKDQSEIDLVPYTQDGLSSFFYVRTLPLEDGKVYEFPMVNNGKLRTVRVTVVRRENLTTKEGEFKTIVVKPEVVLDGILQQNSGDSFMWISDDADRQILKIDAKIKVGSVIAYLRERTSGAIGSIERASGATERSNGADSPK